MSEDEVPLQRQFLLRSISDALGHISVQETAERLGFSYETVSRWRNQNDPGRDALRQIFLRMHGPKGGVATYDGVEDDAQTFADSHQQLLEVNAGDRKLQDVSSSYAFEFLQMIGEAIKPEVTSERELGNLKRVEETEVVYTISDIPPNRPFNISFQTDTGVSFNTQIKRARKERPELLANSESEITVQIKIRRPSRNSDGEPRMIAMTVTSPNTDCLSLEDLNWLVTTMRARKADDGISEIHETVRILQD